MARVRTQELKKSQSLGYSFFDLLGQGGNAVCLSDNRCPSAYAISLVFEGATPRRREGFMETTIKAPSVTVVNELPIRVREAAVFLGVSPQTVYLWVERKQIFHLRVMGRNIRFLKSDLEPFRAQFKQEVENWQDR